MKLIISLIAIFSISISFSQSWQDVGGGTNNSSHGMLVYDGKLINLGSYNSPCNRVSAWDGATWECLDGGVGIVARAGCVWQGKLVVVGDFWNNFQPCAGCNGVAVWDGVSWTALDQGFNNDVLTCTVYNGDLIIGGDFTEANGVPINRVARWNETTSTFESMGAVTDMDNDVRCMTEFEGELWVGGDFNNIGGQGPLDGLVKWDETTQVWVGGNSGVDLIGGVNETVRVLYVNPNDGNLYMGGEFPELWDGDAAAEDFNMAGVAMYDGSNWTPLGTGLNEYCRAIHEYNGDLIVGGYFTTADGVACNKIAKWNTTTQTFSPMGLGFDATGIDEYVKSAMTWNGIFFAGGAYTQAEGAPMNYIAQWYEAPTSAPTAAINSSATTSCEGVCVDFLDISTNGPTAWTWSFPGSDTPSSSNQNPGSICWASAGTYTVSLEACNGNGCNTTTMDITIVSSPTLSVNSATICEGESVTLTATPSSGGGNYSWTPTSETTASIIVSPASTTTYTVVYSLGGCSSPIETSTVTVASSYNISENQTVCEGDAITYPDGSSETITVATSHTSTLVSVDGCDSIIVTNVGMNVAYNSSENIFACENSSVTYPDGTSEIIAASTSHTSLLNTVDGCDSTIVTNVTMQSVYSNTENDNACMNTTYTYPDGFSETITGNTSHTSALTSVAGCDSTIVTNVTMNPEYNLSENTNACENSTYTYPDGFTETITANASHTSNLTTAAGCDSTIVTNVTMVTAYNQTESISACENTTVTYPDGTTETITGNTSHTSLLTATSGCDSTIVSNVTMNSNYNLSENIDACENSTVTYPDGSTATITGNTSHTSNLSSVFGCDSIIVTNVTMQTVYNGTENINVCENTNYTYPDGFSELITNNSSHTSSLTSIAGCDSIIITNVTMNSEYNLSENMEACENSTYTYPDGSSETITVNTSHTSNLTSLAGCDSTIVTNITMVTAYNQTENISVCENSSVTYPDGSSEVITGSTTHTSSLTSSTGCDSTIVTNVTMNSNYNLSENIDACENSTVTYPDGSTETINGNTSHTSNLTSAFGCDSIIVTNVTMNQVYNSSEAATVCEGSTYIYPDGFSETITGNSSHTSILSSLSGCDSTVVTNVTMATNYNQNVNLDVCSGSTFMYPDGTVSTNITVNESHTSMLSTVDNCDSTIVTNLTVATVLNYTNDVNICSGENYTYPDGTSSTNITMDESYVATLTSQNGCDSIITTNITVNPIPSLTTTDATICDGETVTLTASPSIGGGTYSWSPTNETTQDIIVSPNTTTTYNVIYTLDGCASNSVASIVTVNPMPDISTSTTSNVISSLQVGGNYQWLDCDNGNSEINGEINQDYSPTANGNYAVEINLDGCADTSECVAITTIGLDDLSLQELEFYPNPVVNELIFVNSDQIQNGNYTIYDEIGKVILEGDLLQSMKIDVTQLSKGIYLIKFEQTHLKPLRFVKQ